MSRRIVVFGDYYIEEDRITPFMRRWLEKRRVTPTLADYTIRVKRPTIVRRHIRRTRFKVAPVRRHQRRAKRVFHRKFMTGIEIENLKKLAKKHGVEKDLVDWKHEIDHSLSYYENKRIMEEKIKKIAPTVEIETMTTEEIEGEFEKYVNDLRFRASIGDIEAIEELRNLGLN